MRPLSDTYRAFAQFEIFSARSGLPSMRHIPSGILLHSRIDPVSEALDVAQANIQLNADATVIIGGGLGYLAEAVSRIMGCDHPVWVLEFDAAVYALAHEVRPDAEYFTNDAIRIVCSSASGSLMDRVSMIPNQANVIVSPYLLRLIEHEKYPLSNLLHIMRSERASKDLYEPLLAAHAIQTREFRSRLQSVREIQLPAGITVIVTGAGPSLDACLPFILNHRKDVVLIAASGSVPVLQNGNIEPDWVIALEAKDTVVQDVKSLTAESTLVVFPSTHPAVFNGGPVHYMSGGSETEDILETRGGSSVIPALSLALKNSTAPVLLIGVDLGHQNGHYAHAAKREQAAGPSTNGFPPKYASMRAGLERVIAASKSAKGRVFHVLEHGNPLNSAVKLSPQDLSQQFNKFLNAQN
jgi:hypothetical protein